MDLTVNLAMQESYTVLYSRAHAYSGWEPIQYLGTYYVPNTVPVPTSYTVPPCPIPDTSKPKTKTQKMAGSRFAMGDGMGHVGGLVGVVGLAANRRRFLTVKYAEGSQPSSWLNQHQRPRSRSNKTLRAAS